MTLVAGQKLGPYEIVESAGAGGMGEVYKAHDSRLERIVAIKVLPALYAGDQGLKSRFEREAKAISKLNHPNICSLYDIGHENGTDYLVLEFLSGETLAARLKRGALTSEELIRYASQVADALERAHKQGLVHRDLKPANIMLTKDGAKLLDFGLAKIQVKEGVVEGVEGVTRTTPLTGEGTIIGTIQYMSPEQLEGKEADSRSDIFAFGTVLYEMATGQRAFQGGSQASLIAAILREEPRSISELQPMSPPMLDRAIKQCLAKDPDHRWQSAGDLKRALQWVSEGGSQVGIPLPVSVRRKNRERSLWAVSGVLLLAALTLGYLHLSQPHPISKVSRFIIDAPRGQSNVMWPRLSPDGSMFVFIASDTLGQYGIYLRPMNSLEPHLLVKISSGESRPFWSPDSKQLAYFENKQLKKISVGGGLAQLICETPTGYDGSWGAGGAIVFDGLRTDSLRQVPATGGSPTAASKINRAEGEKNGVWPCFLPDGEHFLYLAGVDLSNNQSLLKVGSIKTLESTTLTQVNSRVEYGNGYVLYVKSNLLVAQKFDESKLALVGEPVPLSDNVSGLADRAYFSTSNDGTLIFERGNAGGQNAVFSVDRRGDSSLTVLPGAEYSDFSLSPDNSRLAYGLLSEDQGLPDVWIRDLKRGTNSRLTFGPKVNVYPIWSPDGSTLYFESNRNGDLFEIMQRKANGTGSDEKVFAMDSVSIFVTNVSRDGSTMVLNVGRNQNDIWLLNLGSHKAEPLLEQAYSEGRGALSPDGRFLAYQSRETGNPEIYIRELSATGGKWQVSTAHGACPKWRSDGKELYYISDENNFMSVSIAYDKDLQIGTPVKLFNHRISLTGARTICPYDVTSDGRRFYLLAPTEFVGGSEFVMVQNWMEELKK